MLARTLGTLGAKTRQLKVLVVPAAVVVTGLAVAGAAVGARQAVAAVGGGTQVVPGGIVRDATGGSYDPLRSIYTPATRSLATTVVLATQPRAGAIVKDSTGGYYDPARSVYVPAQLAAGSPPISSSSAGFSWADASFGAAIATGTILALLAATFLTVRHRRLAP